MTFMTPSFFRNVICRESVAQNVAQLNDEGLGSIAPGLASLSGT